MKNSLPVGDKVDAALASVENIERATPSPWFYTRLMQNINQGNATIWERLSAFLLLPKVAFSVISFVIIINAVVLYSKFSAHVSSAEIPEFTLTDEYSLAASSFYDLENEKP